MKILVVVDMQNDFVTGSLGNKYAQAIVPSVVKKVNEFDGQIIFTKDTHSEKGYFETEEGKNYPVLHCLFNTWGWQIIDELKQKANQQPIILKNTFGSLHLGNYIKQLLLGAPKFDKLIKESSGDSIEVIGVCTGICVISNVAILKSCFPNIPIYVDESCCACVTPESHRTAIEAMKMMQVHII